VRLTNSVLEEILVGLVDVNLFLAPILEAGPCAYPFVADRFIYNSLRADPKSPLPTNIDRLGTYSRIKSHFWREYCRIGVDTLSPWERQEPFRLAVASRVQCSLAIPNVRLVWSAPEVLLSPAGWSTIVWLRIIGGLTMSMLPEVLWSLTEQPVLAIAPGGPRDLTLDAALDELAHRIGQELQGSSSGPRPTRIMRERVVSPLAPPIAEKCEPYSVDDQRLILSVLTPLRSEMDESKSMEGGAHTVDQLGGAVTFRYGRGALIDLIGQWPHRIRCFTRNFCHMLDRGAILEGMINHGVRHLSPVSLAVSPRYETQESVTRLRQLVFGAQTTLGSLPDAWPTRVCRLYCASHQGIRRAVELPMPKL